MQDSKWSLVQNCIPESFTPCCSPLTPLQREEEQAVEREKAAQVKREREDLAQKEDAERQKRRKVTNVTVKHRQKCPMTDAR